MRVGIVTMGCDKNTVDNEYLAGLLDRQGAECVPAGAPDEAADDLDAVVIATCAFTEAAREENVDRIVEWAERKSNSDRLRRLYLSGCLAQRFADDLAESIPEVDGLVGVGQWGRMAEMILGERPEILHPRPDRESVLVNLRDALPRKSLDSLPYAYLKIADGCNHKCAFCSIPLMKGRMRSVPVEIVLDEARGLIDRGAREINLVAQDLADYGRDDAGLPRIDGLVERIAELPGDFRVRLLYLYPAGVTDRLLDLIAEHPKVCRYVDMPLQHLDRDVMRAMRRPHAQTRVEGLIEKMRARVPDLALRTTIIVGFPGETEAQFEALLEKVRALEFTWLGAFRFSEEEGTPSATMPDQVAPEIREERYNRLMEAQQEIATRNAARRVGSECRVLIEAAAESPEGWYVGRSEFEAPEVDALIFVESPRPLSSGEWVDARIENHSVYDLFAKVTA